MASLADLLRATDTGGEVTVLEPLPTFFVHSTYSGSNYAGSVVDSYCNVVTSGYYDTGSEQWANYSSYGRTDSSIGTSGQSTSWYGGTPTMQAEGHYGYNYPTNGFGYSPVFRGQSAPISNRWPYFGITIGPSGYRQRVSFYLNGNTIGLDARGGHSLGNFSFNSSTFINTSGEPSTTTYGQICYNERVNTLALMRGNSSNSYRLHVWVNPNINLNKEDVGSADLRKFMADARSGLNGASYYYNDFSWSTSGSSSYDESRYHNRLVWGDNNYVGLVRFTPSNQTWVGWMRPNPASTSPLNNPTSVQTLGNTTSYGIEQGWPYGLRTNITWDNSFVAAYAPYYYYGSGINLFFISTEDPRVSYYYQDSNNSWGYQTFPIGAREFAIHYQGNNVDSGTGLYIQVFSPQGAYKTGRNSNSGSAISTGGALTGQTTYLSVDTGYTSTNYPHLGPMSSWANVER